MERLNWWTIINCIVKNCDGASVIEARKTMLTHGLKPLDSIPPSQHSVVQHATRAQQLTVAFVWKNSVTPNPSECGWKWNPYCRDLADVSKACSLLLHYGCLFSCSTLCKCEAGCTNNDSETWLCSSILMFSVFIYFVFPFRSYLVNTIYLIFCCDITWYHVLKRQSIVAK